MEIITNVQAIDNIIKELQTLKQQFEIMERELSRLEKKEIELQEMLQTRIKYTRELEQDLFENARNHVVPKDEVIHKQHIVNLIFHHWNVKSLTGEEFANALAALVGEFL